VVKAVEADTLPTLQRIPRCPGNVLVGLSDMSVRVSESESEEGVEADESVSARTRADRTRVASRTMKDAQSQQLLHPSQPDDVDTRHSLGHCLARRRRDIPIVGATATATSSRRRAGQ